MCNKNDQATASAIMSSSIKYYWPNCPFITTIELQCAVVLWLQQVDINTCSKSSRVHASIIISSCSCLGTYTGWAPPSRATTKTSHRQTGIANSLDLIRLPLDSWGKLSKLENLQNCCDNNFLASGGYLVIRK